MKRTIVITVLTFVGLGLHAQTLENVNLLNTTGLHGSPRYAGMGGAFMALGNDLSAMHLNPAASAIFRKDNFGLSLGFQGQTNQTSFLNQTQDDNTLDVVFENIGYVKKFGRGERFSFGIGYNRLADFNTSYNSSGVNKFDTSASGIQSGFTLGEYWLAGAGTFSIDELENMGLFEEASAAAIDLLPIDTNGQPFVNYFVDDATDVNYRYQENGGRSEITLNFGGAANQQLYWGAGLGFPTLNYSVGTVFSETGFADGSEFTAVDLIRNNTVNANGINLKAGLIFRPVQFLRVGVSYQSPSWYRVNEVYTVRVDGYTSSGAFRGTEYIFDDISYGVTTPAIYRVGVAGVAGKHFIISGDLEYTDPSKTTLNAKNNNNYESDEQLYQEATTQSLAFKLGGELRFGPLYFRAGFQQRSSNFKPSSEYQSDQTVYSGGIGFKNGRFGLDIAYAQSIYSQSYQAHKFLAYENDPNQGIGYDDANPERATVSNDISIGSLILGFNLSF